jgi:hypothetical protein
MIPVRKYKALWDFIASQVTAIKTVFMVDDETELAVKIKEVEDKRIILVVVTPSSDLNAADEDNFGDIDSCIIYVIMKIDIRNESDDDSMDERELTQNTMTAVRSLMFDLEGKCDGSDASNIMKQIVRGKQHIDRERNYLGCNGYSLSFGVKTNGF